MTVFLPTFSNKVRWPHCWCTQPGSSGPGSRPGLGHCCVLGRVRTGPGKPGKSWNFVVAFSRTGKCWKKATGP